MKKILVVLVVIIGFGISAKAQDQYTVSVPVVVWKIYKTGNGVEVKTIKSEEFIKQYGVYSASSERDAISKIYEMATRDYPCKNDKYSHSEELNGKTCQVYYRYCANTPYATATKK
ncbi:MAG: hypothetical protein LBU44_02700 [Mediterranea sp.]|jgi:hypothetical protein|nr:hypothetical protein [Mediterranea sp.]